MLIKNITYTDYNGEERSEDFYFNLNKAEIIKWLSTTGGYTLDKVLERLAVERNAQKIMDVFDDLIYRSYGRPSLDGKRFEKNDEIKKEFMESEAYSVLFTELVNDADKAADFINGIIPADLADEISKVAKSDKSAGEYADQPTLTPLA